MTARTKSRRELELLRELERLAEMAFVDALTGLRNRRALDRDLPRQIALATRGARPLTVVVGDLDGLKAINDGQGHGAGDLALRTLGAALSSVLRAGDTAYRIGGDEFLLVLPDSGAEEAAAVVARVRGAAPPFSWGTATLPADGVDGGQLIDAADSRLLGRRNACRSQCEPTRRRCGTTKHRDGLRVFTAAAMVVAGVLGGISLGFAADSIGGRGHEPAALSVNGPAATTTGGQTVEAAGGLPETVDAARGAEDAVVTGVAVAAIPAGSPTSTSAPAATLLDDPAVEIPTPTIVLGEVVIRLNPLPSVPAVDPAPLLEPESTPSQGEAKDRPSTGKSGHADGDGSREPKGRRGQS